MKKLIILLIATLMLVACTADARLIGSNVGSLATKTEETKENKKQDGKSKESAEAKQDKAKNTVSKDKEVAGSDYEKSGGKNHYSDYMGQGRPQTSNNQPSKDTVKPGVTAPETSKPNKDKEIYQVVFMNHLDELIREDYVYEGGSVVAPEVEALEGRYFTGWDQLLTNIQTDLIVRPIYNAYRYPVDVLLEDGTYIGMRTFEHGTNIDYIKTYLNLAYGPILDLEEQYYITEINGDFETLTKASEVTVKLGIKELNLEYYVDGELDQSQTLEFGEKINYPAPKKVKEGYQFIAWEAEFNEEESLPEIAQPYYHGQTLRFNAVHEIKTFDVNFKVNDKIVHSEKVTWNNKPSEIKQVQLDEFIPEGHYFVKWDKAINAIKEDTNFNAILEKEEYIVKFVDSKGNAIKTQTVSHGDHIELPENNEVIEGYHFVKWSHDGKNIKSDLTIKPEFAKNIYDVTFYVGANTETQPYAPILTVQVEHGEPIPFDLFFEPSARTYIFKGWDVDTDIVTENMHIYPIFEEDPNAITIPVDTIDENGEIKTIQVRGYALDINAEALGDIVNNHRKTHDLEALEISSKLNQAALERAAQVSVHFDHKSPTGLDFNQAVKYAMYANGENIAAGSEFAENTFSQWKNSPGHNANMLRQGFKAYGSAGFIPEIGLPTWVQLFSSTDLEIIENEANYQ